MYWGAPNEFPKQSFFNYHHPQKTQGDMYWESSQDIYDSGIMFILRVLILPQTLIIREVYLLKPQEICSRIWSTVILTSEYFLDYKYQDI